MIFLYVFTVCQHDTEARNVCQVRVFMYFVNICICIFLLNVIRILVKNLVNLSDINVFLSTIIICNTTT